MEEISGLVLIFVVFWLFFRAGEISKEIDFINLTIKQQDIGIGKNNYKCEKVNKNE